MVNGTYTDVPATATSFNKARVTLAPCYQGYTLEAKNPLGVAIFAIPEGKAGIKDLACARATATRFNKARVTLAPCYQGYTLEAKNPLGVAAYPGACAWRRGPVPDSCSG